MSQQNYLMNLPGLYAFINKEFPLFIVMICLVVFALPGTDRSGEIYSPNLLS